METVDFELFVEKPHGIMILPDIIAFPPKEEIMNLFMENEWRNIVNYYHDLFKWHEYESNSKV